MNLCTRQKAKHVLYLKFFRVAAFSQQVEAYYGTSVHLYFKT